MDRPWRVDQESVRLHGRVYVGDVLSQFGGHCVCCLFGGAFNRYLALATACCMGRGLLSARGSQVRACGGAPTQTRFRRG